MRRLGWVAIGLLAWLLTQAVALGLGGAGHGWMAPLWVSSVLIFLYPLVVVRVFASPAASIKVDATILLLAGVIDLFLLHNALVTERTYFSRVWNSSAGAVGLWIGLWAGWQLLAIVSLLKKRGGETKVETY